jgi:hypothetical protein
MSFAAGLTIILAVLIPCAIFTGVMVWLIARPGTRRRNR